MFYQSFSSFEWDVTIAEVVSFEFNNKRFSVIKPGWAKKVTKGRIKTRLFEVVSNHRYAKN